VGSVHTAIPLDPKARKKDAKQAEALPLSCLTLDWAAQWAGYLGFPQFVCYTSEANCPEPCQGGREAAVFQGNTFEGRVGQA